MQISEYVTFLVVLNFSIYEYTIFTVDNIAVSHEQIKVAVMSGQRPDLSAITGPETLVKHITECISRCWHQSPDRRPSFAGTY